METRAEVDYGFGTKSVMQIDEGIVESAPKVYIYNVGPQQFVVSKGGLGEFLIHGCKPGERVSEPLIIKGRHPEHRDSGLGIVTVAYINGMDLAKDIVGTDSADKAIQFQTSNLEWHGVFITNNKVPTDKEIAAAKEKRRQRNLLLIQLADNAHMQGRHQDILAPHREAALEEKQKKAWAQTPTSLDNCPACGTSILPGIAVCPSCSAVLDMEKARKFFPGRFEPEQTQQPAPKGK